MTRAMTKLLGSAGFFQTAFTATGIPHGDYDATTLDMWRSEVGCSRHSCRLNSGIPRILSRQVA